MTNIKEESFLSNIGSIIKNSVIFGIGFCLTCLVFLAGYAAWTNLATVNNGDTLTSNGWNDLVNKINSIGARTDGINQAGSNVGIGTASPSQKLDVVGGSIKAGSGLIIEVRTENPASPETGRMWLINP